MKSKFKGLGVFGASFGIWLSRNFGNNNYFGLNGRVIFGLVCALFILTAIIELILKKSYFLSLLIIILVTPMFVGFIGIYCDNIYLVSGGLIVFLIILSIYLIIIKRFKKNKDTIDYDKYKNNLYIP